MILESDRLILRTWEIKDAKSLYVYSKDNRIGLNAGWKPNTSVKQCEEVIKNIFLKAPYNFAICKKEDNIAIGAISLKLKGKSTFAQSNDEGELGFWIGVSFWNNGYMTEAIKTIQKFAFYRLNFSKLFCAYYKGNVQSKRVQEKCGFKYVKTIENYLIEQLDEKRDCIVNEISKEDWERSSGLR